MNIALYIAQWTVGLGILNVWLVRPKKATGFRGGDARNLKEEFAVYGLPVWFMILIGVCKVTLALMLMAGTWLPELVRPAALGMAILMTGAVLMHIRVRDSFKQTSASIAVLTLVLFIAFAAG